MFSETLSFTFVMDLYLIKCGAESRGDNSALESMKEHYPELFADDFQEFIESLKITTAYLDEKYDQDFSSNLFPTSITQEHKLN